MESIQLVVDVPGTYLVYTTGLVRVNTDIPLQDRYLTGSGYSYSQLT